MSWQPHYLNSDRLLTTVRRIGEAMGEIRATRFPSDTLAQLEYQARELSSFASTSIEGNPLRLTDVKRLLKQAPAYIRDTEKEVLNYNRALQAVYQSVKAGHFQINRASLEWVQSMVVDGLMDNPADVGHLRQRPVIIRDPRRVDTIIFLPPDAQEVPTLLEELLEFIRTNLQRLDPIVVAGLFHRQHVIIHPFMDGNGRTTRIFTTAILGMSGLDLFGIFSFENYYNQNITRYFKEVGLVGDYYDHQAQGLIDFTAWLEYFADGLLDELNRVQKHIATLSMPIRLAPPLQQILDYLEVHGSITQQEYGQITQRSLASRKIDFKTLIKLGLIEARGGSRNTYYCKLNPA